jgi:hypothetical protein
MSKSGTFVLTPTVAGPSYFKSGASRKIFRALPSGMNSSGGLGNLSYTVGSPIFASNNGRPRATKIEKVTRNLCFTHLKHVPPSGAGIHIIHKSYERKVRFLPSVFFYWALPPAAA